MIADTKNFSTAEVAKMAGIHRDTLLRWLRQGLVSEPKRDRREWRIFSEEEAREIVQFATSESFQESLRHDSNDFSRLKDIDWDFKGAKTSYLTHSIHPYPAKYIPQIPNALIQELSSVGDTVADIFCGSGTTLVEALTLKRNAIGLDANPLACLISRAKTNRLTEGDEGNLKNLIERAQDLASSIFIQDGELPFNLAPFTSEAFRPSADAISFWFEPHIVEELAEVLSWCRSLPTVNSQELALTSLSSIIVSVSKQDSDTRYVRRSKNIKSGETLSKICSCTI